MWERVGNSLEMQATLKPWEARPKAARRPAPPAPMTMQSYLWSTTWYEESVERARWDVRGRNRVFDRRDPERIISAIKSVPLRKISEIKWFLGDF